MSSRRPQSPASGATRPPGAAGPEAAAATLSGGPLEDSEEIGLSTQTASMALPPLAGRRVLLLDDNVELRETYAAALEEAGLSVVETGCRRAALVHVAGRTLDAVVVDLVMPDVNGLDFLRNVRGNARGASLPAILLSTLPQGGTREAARLALDRLGRAAFLDKPVTPRVLLQHIELILLPR